ncbi:MAG: hypothetical protein LAT76_10755 [Schleiferiaceae bacterium]|nr:hypothetical protein [Schleiferiaceae bacterium]
MPSAGVYRCAGSALDRSLLRAPGGLQFMECVWGMGVGLCFVGVRRVPIGLDALTRLGLEQQTKAPAVGVYRCAGSALDRSLLRAPGGLQFMECLWGHMKTEVS